MRERMGRFTAAYLMCGDAKQAALTAGYSAEYARSQAYKLVKHPEVAAAIETGAIPEEWAPCQVTNERATEILSAIVLATPEMFLNRYGSFSVEEGGVFKHAIREMTLTEDRDGRPTAKIKLWDKIRALRELRRWNEETGCEGEKVEAGGPTQHTKGHESLPDEAGEELEERPESRTGEELEERPESRTGEELEERQGSTITSTITSRTGVTGATEDSTEVLVGSELGSVEKPTKDVGRLPRKERRKLELAERRAKKKAAKRALRAKPGR